MIILMILMIMIIMMMMIIMVVLLMVPMMVMMPLAGVGAFEFGSRSERYGRVQRSSSMQL